jgi:hypothetical protein
MAFVYEKLAEDEIVNYDNLGFNAPYEWFIDKENDASIWVTSNSRGWQDHAEGNVKTIVKLRIENQVIDFYMEKSPQSSQSFSDTPFYIIWDGATKVVPEDLYTIDYKKVTTLLKAGLTAWGGGHHNNIKWHPNFIVQFNF